MATLLFVSAPGAPEMQYDVSQLGKDIQFNSVSICLYSAVYNIIVSRCFTEPLT